MKRMLALLLCLALTTSLCACGSTASSSPSSAPAEEGPSAMELALETYQTAADALNAMSDVTINFDIEQTVIVNGNEFSEITDLTINYKGLGSDGLRVHSAGTSTWGERKVFRSETYADGLMSGYVDWAFYTAPTDAETFLSLYPDIQMIDPALYGRVEQAEDGTLHFSDGSVPERWAAAEGPEAREAYGTVTLDETGAIAESSYFVSYALGAVEYRISATAVYTPGSEDISMSSNVGDYPEVSHPAAVLMVERARGYLLQATDLTASYLDCINVEAGDFAYISQEVLNYSDSGALTARLDYTEQIVELSTGSADLYTYSLRFDNGTYTTISDGAETTNPAVTEEDMRAYCQDLRSYYAGWLDILSYMEDCTVTVLGDLCAVEYTLPLDSGESFCDSICSLLWDDERYLDQYASNYRTDNLYGYIGIDLITGLPTAWVMGYKGCHTIDGVDYALTREYVLSLFAASNTVHETVSGMMPAEDADAPTPLFYHVTGENGEELWLLGTIHVGDPRTTVLPQEIYDAFDASDALAVEFDAGAFADQIENEPELAAQVAESYYYTDGSTLADHLSDSELYDYAVAYCRAAGLYSLAMEQMTASTWSNLIDNFHLQRSYTLNSGYGVDTQLLQRAEQQGKQVLDVESALSQLQMLTGYSDAVQEMLLANSLASSSYSYGLGVTQLYEAWCAGDEADLIELIKGDTSALTEEELALYEEYNDALTVQRNETMLEVAMDYLSSGDTVFYAVGLAHLITENGLVNTLRDAGYTVELVEYAE